MAFLQMNYHSDALKMGVSVNVILPEKAKTVIGMSADGKDTYKTLYLLHLPNFPLLFITKFYDKT